MKLAKRCWNECDTHAVLVKLSISSERLFEESLWFGYGRETSFTWLFFDFHSSRYLSIFGCANGLIETEKNQSICAGQWGVCNTRAKWRMHACGKQISFH